MNLCSEVMGNVLIANMKCCTMMAQFLVVFGIVEKISIRVAATIENDQTLATWYLIIMLRTSDMLVWDWIL
jgi:hypothetical protein